VLVPRRLAHGEHVDDHQTQIAGELSSRGLAVSVDAGELSLEHLELAAATNVATLPEDPPFHTRGGSVPARQDAAVAERAAL
jgi:UDP-N-acetylglucosamine transferase subunit ALG13